MDTQITFMIIFLSYAGKRANVAKADGWRKSFPGEVTTELSKLLMELTDSAPPNWKGTPCWTGIIKNAGKGDWPANSVTPQGVRKPRNVAVYILDTPESSLNARNGNPRPETRRV